MVTIYCWMMNGLGELCHTPAVLRRGVVGESYCLVTIESKVAKMAARRASEVGLAIARRPLLALRAAI